MASVRFGLGRRGDAEMGDAGTGRTMGGPPPPKKTSTRQNLDFIGFYSFFSVRKNVRSRQNPSGKRQVRFGAVRGWATARAPTRRWGRRGDAETRRRGEKQGARTIGRRGIHTPLQGVTVYPTLYLLKIMMVSGCTKLHQARGCTILNGLWNLS
jgi:hypothetical protein